MSQTPKRASGGRRSRRSGSYRSRWSRVGYRSRRAGRFDPRRDAPVRPPPVGAATAVLDWLRITHQGAVLTRYGTQSLPGFAFFFGWPSAVVLALELCCFAAVAFALGRPASGDPIFFDIGAVTLLAVLVSPIAWLYYYTLAFPAWLALLQRPRPYDPWVRASLLIAGVLTSGVLTFGLYPNFLWFIRDPNYTW